jgi:hypothetical protein
MPIEFANEISRMQQPCHVQQIDTNRKNRMIPPLLCFCALSIRLTQPMLAQQLNNLLDLRQNL